MALAMSGALAVTAASAVGPSESFVAQAIAAPNMAGLSVTDKQRVVAQAVEEMINLYRVRHGLHPLLVHVELADQAENWSRQMAHYSSPTRYDGFGHSPDSGNGGLSGENIAAFTTPGRKPASRLTDAEWAQMAIDMFETWRTSPRTHNDTMLDQKHMAMAVGIVVDKESVFGTTVFSHPELWLQGVGGGGHRGDRAWDSLSRSFDRTYLPGGALNTLGLGGWRAPSDPGRKNRVLWTSKSDVLEGWPLDRSEGRPVRSDERISRPLLGGTAPAPHNPGGAPGPAAPGWGTSPADFEDTAVLIDALSSKLGIPEKVAVGLSTAAVVVLLAVVIVQQLGIRLPFIG
ncbi:hypothetical protein CAQUA_06335 [Corynebacterium aquatimens]|nr:hypothetical protein CAQUA_06335 [Corynebacterium aquatimens]